MSFDSAQFLRNPIRMDRQDFMTPNVMSEIAQTKVADSGRLAGVEVTVVEDPMAELQDSMEELSMMFEEKTMKKLGDRKLGEKMEKRSSYVESLDAWMKTLPDMPNKDQLDGVLRFLRQASRQGNLPSFGEMKQMLANLAKDPSVQFAMLDILEQALGENEGDIRSLLSNTRGSLIAERGGEIRAGINLATEVNARATTAEEMSNLRNLYRSEILGFTSPQDCFRSILAQRGPGALANAIDFLRAGCGADLSCDQPSRDPVALRRIMTDLQCVQVLKTVLDSMEALSSRMMREFGISLKRDGESMTGTIVGFTEKGNVQESELSDFERECGINKLLARMDFAREMLVVFRKLSPRLFELEDDRLHLIEVGEEHLDGIIAEENQQEEDQDRDKEDSL